MSQEFDNRIQFPPTEIDFTDDVGTTGQEHDIVPAPSQQPRYDWIRMYLIGLLANQSSETAPTQYRTGTIWYNRTINAFEFYNGTEWKQISAGILLKLSPTDVGTSLQDFFELVNSKLASIKQEFTFSGTTTSTVASKIPVPATIVAELEPDVYRPLLYINGLLQDPRNYNFCVGCPNTIDLVAPLTLKKNDVFTVLIKHFDIFENSTVYA